MFIIQPDIINQDTIRSLDDFENKQNTTSTARSGAAMNDFRYFPISVIFPISSIFTNSGIFNISGIFTILGMEGGGGVKITGGHFLKMSYRYEKLSKYCHRLLHNISIIYVLLSK